MHDDHDPEIECSPLYQEVAQDGLTVRVQIHRLKTGSGGWSLEVVDDENTSTVWDDLFATDHEALAEFSRTLKAEGIESFLMSSGSAELAPMASAPGGARAEGEELKHLVFTTVSRLPAQIEDRLNRLRELDGEQSPSRRRA
jgi:hypothetical protein